MAKKQTTYKSKDGTKYETEAEADRHDAIMDAKEEYDAARRKLAIALLANEKTADGVAVDICDLTLYCVISKFYAPVVQECKFYWNSWDWGIGDDDRVKLMFKLGTGEKERWVCVHLDELYAKADNARLAVIEAKRAILQDKQRELAEAEANPRLISVMY